MAQIYFFYWDYPYNLQKKLITLKINLVQRLTFCDIVQEIINVI